MGGYQQLVRGEVMRGKFRNSFEKPEPFEPGKPTAVKFTLPDVCHTFRRGHRIMVQVQSTWFPLVDRNPQTFVDIYTREGVRLPEGDAARVPRHVGQAEVAAGVAVRQLLVVQPHQRQAAWRAGRWCACGPRRRAGRTRRWRRTRSPASRRPRPATSGSR